MNSDVKVNQLFNIIPDRDGGFSNPQRGRVYGIDGIAPCCHGFIGGDNKPKILLAENMETENEKKNKKCPHETPISVAMRGRGESGNTRQSLELGTAVANSLTTVQKDSLVMESSDPTVISIQPWNRPGGDVGDISPSVTASAWHHNNFVRLPQEVADTAERLQKLASESRGRQVGVTVNSDFSLRPHKLNKSKDGISDLCTDYDESIGSTAIAARPNNVYGHSTRFRIRRLTPRECYRLMDVPENAIDRLLASEIAKSHHYRLAGNSIVVSCLYYIFRSMFCEPHGSEPQTPRQLQLF